MPGLYSHRDSMRREENQSVKSTFVLSLMFSTCSCLVSKLLERCRYISPESKETRMFQLCLVALTQECRCPHSCVPHVVHISPKVATSAFEESVNLASMLTIVGPGSLFPKYLTSWLGKYRRLWYRW